MTQLQKITTKTIQEKLVEKTDSLAKVLPKQMREDAERLVSTAMLNWMRGTAKLKECTPISYAKAMLDAGQFGFALDGKMAYAIPYNNKKKTSSGEEYWEMEAQCQLSWMALVAVAKRSGKVLDVRSTVVKEGDEFDIYEENGKQIYRYRQNFENQGKPKLVFSVAIFPDNQYRVEVMTPEQVQKVRSCSKSKDSPMWTQFPDEAWKKTCTRRLMKTFQDDPWLLRAFEIDDRDFIFDSREQREQQRDEIRGNAGHLPTSTSTQSMTELVESIRNEVAEPEPEPTDAELDALQAEESER